MRIHPLILLLAVAALPLACKEEVLKDGNYTITVISTNDTHASWFDSTYVGGKVKNSLFAVNTYVDSIRVADGADNVLLIDMGDCLQGDNAAYYYNYVDTLSPHLLPRLFNYMKYDAAVWGNHDVETGHKVYDRINNELSAYGIPILAGNAIRNDNGKSYFPLYTIVRKGGIKVAILGYQNANIKAWLAEDLWSGMHFESIMSRVQKDVNKVRSKEHPDMVIVGVHSGTGNGDGSNLESEARDIFEKVSGVDWVLCSHDHKPYVLSTTSGALMNSGSHCRYISRGKIHVKVSDGKVVGKSFTADLIPIKADKVDTAMRSHFRKDYEAVRAFTKQEVGFLDMDLRTSDAYAGMSDYVNLIHTICLDKSAAELSIAAPLTFNGKVKAGTLIFNDLFTIYPFENQLYVITMTGEEVVNYLEASYARWIKTVKNPGDHLLNINNKENLRTRQKGWSFAELPYNFDSVAGICYTVDVTKPKGERISVISMADGSNFDPQREYKVALTSYRANGGGNLLSEIGINTDHINERVVERYPEIRNLLYDYLKEHTAITHELINDNGLIGYWKFVPESIARPALKKDMELLMFTF